MKRLNNLVTELYAADALPDVPVSIVNSRNGWLYVSCAAGGAASLNGKPIPFHPYDNRLEAMLYVSAGDVSLEGASARDVVVRAVPELAYCKYGYNPFIREYGTYDWAYLQHHVLPHINTVIGRGADDEREHAHEWKARGGKWIVERSLPTSRDAEHDPDVVFEKWIDTPGLTDPLFDGILLDEFFSGDKPSFPAFTKAIKRIAEDPRFRDKQVYPYCGSHYPDRDDWGIYDENDTSKSSVPFYRATFDAGYRVAWERYMQERHEEAIAESFIGERMVANMQRWRNVLPDAAAHMIVALGYMDMGFQLDIHPDVDIKVYRDMQFRAMATAEPFDGLYGITGWTSGYADDETIRWTAKLYRHYGIEGNTEPLSDKFGFAYKTDHIYNGDFRHFWEGWDFPVLNEKSASVVANRDFSALQSRWNKTTCGDTALVMKRIAARPNEFSQPIRNLKPGHTYSVRLISGDYRHFLDGVSEEKRHGIAVTLDGVEIIPEKSFVSVHRQHPTVKVRGFSRKHLYWWNTHRIVFRATEKEARLTISDWQDGKPLGPIGEEIAINFVQVQEYLDD